MTFSNKILEVIDEIDSAAYLTLYHNRETFGIAALVAAIKRHANQISTKISDEQFKELKDMVATINMVTSSDHSVKRYVISELTKVAPNAFKTAVAINSIY